MSGRAGDGLGAPWKLLIADLDRPLVYMDSENNMMCGICGLEIPPSSRSLSYHLTFHGIVNATLRQELMEDAGWG